MPVCPTKGTGLAKTTPALPDSSSAIRLRILPSSGRESAFTKTKASADSPAIPKILLRALAFPLRVSSDKASILASFAWNSLTTSNVWSVHPEQITKILQSPGRFCSEMRFSRRNRILFSSLKAQIPIAVFSGDTQISILPYCSSQPLSIFHN